MNAGHTTPSTTPSVRQLLDTLQAARDVSTLSHGLALEGRADLAEVVTGLHQLATHMAHYLRNPGSEPTAEAAADRIEVRRGDRGEILSVLRVDRFGRLVSIVAQASPAAPEWPKLDKPAKVGNGRFGRGVSARLVVEAAQRLHQQETSPDSEAKRIATATQSLGKLQVAVGARSRADFEPGHLPDDLELSIDDVALHTGMPADWIAKAAKFPAPARTVKVWRGADLNAYHRAAQAELDELQKQLDARLRAPETHE